MRLWTYARTFNPRWVITVLTIVVIVSNLLSDQWRRGTVINGEVARHYRVLPALFYHGSPCSVGDDGRTFGADHDVPVGVAISYLPFFAIAHVAAKLTGFTADGYSVPYQFTVLFSSLVYFIIGLIFLAKLLRLHFPGLVCSITLLSLTFGTNALYYLTHGGGMPHALSFMLCVLFLYQVIAWHQLRDMSSAVQLGLLLGALWLVRPVNGWLVLVFLLYDVRWFRELGARRWLLARKAPQLLMMLLCCAAVTAPQWLYWKCATGELFPDAALGIHEFHFKRPHVLQGLFSFRHGWLVHAPIMTFSIAGFFFLRGYLRMYRWAVPVFFIVYIYILFSWWCWWHGASFGQRVLIDIYPLLAIPFGALVYKLRRLGGAYKHVLYGIIMLLLAVNIWRTYYTEPPAEGEGTCVEASAA